MFTCIQALRVGAILCIAALLSLAPPLAQAQNRMNAKAVAVTSTAPVAEVEAVNFSGQATVYSRLASDREFGKPSLVLLFDLTGVTGVGAQSGIRYVLTSQEHIILPHASTQIVEYIFPMATDENAAIVNVRTGSARFVMNVDMATGVVTSVTSVLTAR